jgi:hypothetical protein
MRHNPFRRNIGFVIALFCLTIGSVMYYTNGRASAVGFDMYDRSLNQSYYANTDETNTGDLVFDSSPDIPWQGITSNWSTVDMNVNSFIAAMEQRLNSPTDYNSARAAAIMNMMMGLNGDDAQYNSPSANRWQNGVAVAKANLTQWETLVREYDAAGDVTWNGFDVGVNEKDWVGLNANDGTKLPDVVPVQLNEVDNDEAMIFHNPNNGGEFTIKKKCGNLTGDVEPLEPFTPPVTPTPPPPTPPTPPPAPPVTEPYFQATGGDVVAGASIATDTTHACGVALSNANAGIVSWNNDSSPDYDGAGSEYAALAMNYIQGFASDQANAGSDQLSLANTNTSGSLDPTNGFFGGMFGDAPCADYWNAHPATATPLPTGNVGTWPSGSYYVTSNQTLSAATIPAGKHIILYVDSDVAITGNISYPPASTVYSSRSEIPSFELVVHGTIYIDSSVTALSGLYAAIPDNNYATTTTASSFNSPSAGTISTCSSGFTSYDPSQFLTNNMASNCAQQLTVTGSFVANQVWLLRSFGGLATKQPAEVFDYSPEIWLAPSGATSSGAASPTYQSIVGLPPIL